MADGTSKCICPASTHQEGLKDELALDSSPLTSPPYRRGDARDRCRSCLSSAGRHARARSRPGSREPVPEEGDGLPPDSFKEASLGENPDLSQRRAGAPSSR